jgi:hypothetical protein
MYAGERKAVVRKIICPYCMAPHEFPESAAGDVQICSQCDRQFFFEEKSSGAPADQGQQDHEDARPVAGECPRCKGTKFVQITLIVGAVLSVPAAVLIPIFGWLSLWVCLIGVVMCRGIISIRQRLWSIDLAVNRAVKFASIREAAQDSQTGRDCE